MVSIRGYGCASYWHSLSYSPPQRSRKYSNGLARTGLGEAGVEGEGEGDGDTPSSVAGRDGTMFCKRGTLAFLSQKEVPQNSPHHPPTHNQILGRPPANAQSQLVSGDHQLTGTTSSPPSCICSENSQLSDRYRCILWCTYIFTTDSRN